MMGREPRSRRLVHDTEHMLLTLSAEIMRGSSQSLVLEGEYGAARTVIFANAFTS